MLEKGKRTERMVAVCLLLAFGGVVGCKSNDTFGVNTNRVETTRSAIESIIPESDRREVMLAIVVSFEKSVMAIETEALDVREQIIEANRDYDTTREELEVLYARLGELVVELGDTAKVNSLALRELCSEEEWKRIADDKSVLVEFKF